MKQNDLNDRDARLERTATEALDNELAPLNEKHAEDFARMRLNALGAMPERSTPQLSWIGYGGAIAASLLIAFVLILSTGEKTVHDKGVDDIDIVLEEIDLEADDIEMLENDIEFYLWMEENDKRIEATKFSPFQNRPALSTT